MLILGILLLLLPFLLSIFLQIKATKSQNKVLLKSFGNFLLLTVIQILLLIAFVFLNIEMNPRSGEASGWLFVMYVLFSPVILIGNLAIIMITHFVQKKKQNSLSK
ncbi:hypothetical protein M3182_16985 [Mesobacillus maritimus]|uniref:hypothetical protein n=1 Tax=Mesobacillus maritimus TaxID=1643336 RepID=UPI00203DE324|nr:hypothetical protein [Mesobacillus maritimus]MCM3587432.1 hypothetical protein [Mesobacillus maritimus]MCM3672188.1 hypothetical protein [Mesobacillus maritimus]